MSDGLLLSVLERLLQLRVALGEEAFERASRAALLTIGRVAVDVAHRNAGLDDDEVSDGNVIRFPDRGPAR
ncbi:hypothetical protein SAMN06295905_1606 [Devosia lucknowensis]|jgi:hypothetical protein|uniref:Uncharacterized protein n=1 Tax=Devosia lucknowensis TaxID=1096929 RepID=A0A1Y6F8D5_9HYPH|nr:hypothetical protein [Devosia lucknowensis]SMQ68623.1 hypothetical protein SAMN06295905_1606 [Devosia lucknowensis]